MKKWLKYLGYGAIAFVAIGIIAVVSDNSKAESNDKTTQPTEIPYSVINKDISGNQLTYKVTINDRTDKASLIEIARKLKAKSDWEEMIVCYFYIKVNSNAAAWAICNYLTDWGGVDPEKDMDGNRVQFIQIGTSKSLADSLRQLKLDTIANKQLIASYIEDLWKCKTELYTVNNDPSKILKAQLFNSGHLLEWMPLQQAGNEKRYSFDDDENNYLVIDEAGKAVHYRKEGKTWQSYGLD